MLYAFVANYKPGITEEQQDRGLARRVQWKYPTGVKAVAEFWAMGVSPGGPLVYSVFEADDITAIWRLVADWNDIFDITIVPVVTVEQGLKIGPEVLASRTR
jgi:hypothetical protein